MSEFGRVVVWVGVQLDPRQTRPSLHERVSDRSRGEDGVDTFDGNGCAQDLDHLLYPWKDVVGLELIDGEWRADENGVCALGTWSDGEDEI